ncbi:uncharacterized protein [Littorina saxatilis]|uniref:uncharacterized protein n=1 Tax=Littorina saxatilis TaxID=31220 RepID=UPI0038B5399F
MNRSSMQETVIPGEVKRTEMNTSRGVYYNGNCTFMTSLSPYQGARRYSYSVSFSPGPEGKPTGKSVTIRSPGDPVTNCPQYVYEGQSVGCDCLVNPSSSGLPPATAQWQGSGPGKQLVISNVTRNVSGHVFNCSLSWGPAGGAVQRQTEYILKVADPPPFPPVISGYNDKSGVTAGNLTLTCTVTGGRPLVTSVNVSCRPDVQGDVSWMNVTNTSVSVTFTILSLEARHDGTECVCTADWEVHRETYNVSASIQLRVMGNLWLIVVLIG